MARSFNTIQSEILRTIAAQPALANLTSTSSTSIWRMLVNTIATALQLNEQLWDVEKLTLEKIAEEAVAGTPAWLQRLVLNFQFGDQIEVRDNFTVAYPSVDAAKRIVTRCSVKQLAGSREVLVKVAKGSPTNLEKLTSSELDSLAAYISKAQFAGTYITAISLEADRIVSDVDVYFDAEYVEAVVKANVMEAITKFFQNLEFDGVLYLSKFIDAVQSVDGVVDVVVNSLRARPYLTELNDASVLAITRTYETDSGYIIPEDTAGYTLAETINMIPNA